MPRPPTPQGLPWDGKLACFAVLICGLFVIMSSVNGSPQPNSAVVVLGGLMVFTPLCFLCKRQGLVQTLLTQAALCIRAFAESRSPRTDP